MEDKEFLLISISGEDRPGVTSAVTKILGEYGAIVLDLGQSNLHHQLNLGILVLVHDTSHSGDMLKQVLSWCSSQNMIVRYTPLTENQFNAWVDRQNKSRYVFTLLARELNARHISLVTAVLAERNLNIDSIVRLSGRPDLSLPYEQRHACVEFAVRGSIEDKDKMQTQLLEISREEGIDISFQRDDMFRRNRRLICVDMDSTFIQTEVIDELADRANVGEQVREITLSAMRGEIDFKESFRRRCALLAGLDVSAKQDIIDHLPITEGADRLFRTLKRCGYKIAILSGGFTFVGEYLQQKFGVDYVYAHTLEEKDGKFTGRHLGEIIDGDRKAELLEQIAHEEGIDLRQVIAVGDGANDLKMLSKAGLGIAFHAKPKVKDASKQAISTIGLDGILYLLGFRDVIVD